MGAAFEVNKQMCDIEKDLSEAGYFRKICEGQIKARKKLRDMEKKKMTKAEAFEHLKGTKVFCKDYDKMEAVQDFLRSLGFYWGDASKEMVLTHTIFLHKDGRLSFALSLQYFREHESPELSADDILSIEIVEEKKILSVDCALEHAKWIMKYLREECSPHTKMIIEGDHAELVEGGGKIGSLEGVSAMTLEELDRLNKGNRLLGKIRQVEADMSLLKDPRFILNWLGYKNEIMAQGFDRFECVVLAEDGTYHKIGLDKVKVIKEEEK